MQAATNINFESDTYGVRLITSCILIIIDSQYLYVLVCTLHVNYLGDQISCNLFGIFLIYAWDKCSFNVSLLADFAKVMEIGSVGKAFSQGEKTFYAHAAGVGN